MNLNTMEGVMTLITEIDLKKVKSVYVGKNGRCCCGCAGTHTRPEEGERAAKIVQNVVRKLNKAIAEAQRVPTVAARLDDLGSCIALESPGGSTVSIVYFD